MPVSYSSCTLYRIKLVLFLDGNHSCIHEGEIRLVAGYDRSEGRVEICYSGTWGTVCGNSWGSNEAMVVCKQLGYSGYFSYTAKFGTGTGSIWLNGLACNGNESNLLSCPSTDPSGCSHLQDVGVRCYGTVIIIYNIHCIH